MRNTIYILLLHTHQKDKPQVTEALGFTYDEDTAIRLLKREHPNLIEVPPSANLRHTIYVIPGRAQLTKWITITQCPLYNYI